MERVVRLRRFGDGDVILPDGDDKRKKKSQQLQTPIPPRRRRSNFGMYQEREYDLTNEAKKQLMSEALGVPGVDDSIVSQDSVFNLQGIERVMNLEKPPKIDLGRLGEVGYANQEFNPATGKWIIYNTPKFQYSSDTFRDMARKMIKTPASSGLYEIKYNYKPKMSEGGIFTPEDLEQIKELGEIFKGLRK